MDRKKLSQSKKQTNHYVIVEPHQLENVAMTFEAKVEEKLYYKNTKYYSHIY